MNQLSAEQSSADRQISAPAQLLVEGRTPEIFFREFIDELQLRDRVDVRTFGSISDLQSYLGVFATKAAFKEKVIKLGIIRDAEEGSAKAAFQSVCSSLKNSKLPMPDGMQCFSPTSPSVGIYILPDCDRAGMLETLCLEAAEECEAESGKKILPCVEKLLTCATEAGTRFDNLTKARFAGYALARGVIDPQLGRAAQKRIVPCRARAFNKLTSFIRELAS